MEIINLIQDKLYDSILKLGYSGLERRDIQVEGTEERSHGDYASNVAMKLSKELKKSPREIAEEIVKNIERGEEIEKIEVAGPGFINFYITSKYLFNTALEILNDPDGYFKLDAKKGKKIVIEYTDPNPFKILHVGHLYTNIVGESFARLQEALGADVKRAIYQGDVGLHVAKTLWGLITKLDTEEKVFKDIEGLELEERVKYLGDAYILGVEYYDKIEDEKAKKEIDDLNYYISCMFIPSLPKKDFSEYGKEGIEDMFLKGRGWCMEYFETIYKILGSKFDYYFLESEVSSMGLELVKENIGPVFKESEGAVIYEGDPKKGLHTRVFINKYGVPTYEAKDFGLAVRKSELIDYDESIIITGKEQAGYFKVMLDALGNVRKALAERTKHIPHGLIKAVDGKKISSRKGAATAEDLITNTKDQVIEMMKENGKVTENIDEIGQKIAVAAIKYAFIKVGVGGDIVFDPTKALSFDGDTGPYLLYVYARCRSLLKNGGDINGVDISEMDNNSFVKELLLSLGRAKSILLASGVNYSPSTLSQYLFDLAQVFNNLYQNVNILNAPDKEKQILLAITKATMLTLGNGLNLLGIDTVDEM